MEIEKKEEFGIDLPTLHDYLNIEKNAVFIDETTTRLASYATWNDKEYKNKFIGCNSELSLWDLANHLIGLANYIQAIILHEHIFTFFGLPTNESQLHDCVDLITPEWNGDENILKSFPELYQQCITSYTYLMWSCCGFSNMFELMPPVRAAGDYKLFIFDESIRSLGYNLRMAGLGVNISWNSRLIDFAVPLLQNLYENKGQSFSEICMNLLKDIKTKKSIRLNYLRKAPIYCVDLPLLFVKVLSQSRTPEEIIPRALELRNRSSTRKFREWALSIENSLSMDEFDKAFQEVEKIADNIASDINRPQKDISIGICGIKTSIKVPDLILNPKGHISFITDLCGVADKKSEIEQYITKIYKVNGKSVMNKIQMFYNK